MSESNCGNCPFWVEAPKAEEMRKELDFVQTWEKVRGTCRRYPKIEMTWNTHWCFGHPDLMDKVEMERAFAFGDEDFDTMEEVALRVADQRAELEGKVAHIEMAMPFTPEAQGVSFTMKDVGQGVWVVMHEKQILCYIAPRPETSQAWVIDPKVPIEMELAPGRIG